MAQVKRKDEIKNIKNRLEQIHPGLTWEKIIIDGIKELYRKELKWQE